MAKISAMMGYAYNNLPTKQLIKFRQSMDIFLDKLVVLTSPKTTNDMLLQEMRKKNQEKITNA